MSSFRFFRSMCVFSASVWVLLFVLGVTGVHAQERLPLSAAEVPRLQLSAASDLSSDKPRWHSGYLIAGVSLLVSGYLSSAALGGLITGLNEYECEHESSRACDNARPLFIPVVGPGIAKTDYPGILAANLVVSQFVGLAFIVVGAVLPSEPSHATHGAASVRVAAVPLWGGALLATQLML